jgi:hypothetical protein
MVSARRRVADAGASAEASASTATEPQKRKARSLAGCSRTLLITNFRIANGNGRGKEKEGVWGYRGNGKAAIVVASRKLPVLLSSFGVHRLRKADPGSLITVSQGVYVTEATWRVPFRDCSHLGHLPLKSTQMHAFPQSALCYDPAK